jgi:hypothetical protein
VRRGTQQQLHMIGAHVLVGSEAGAVLRRSGLWVSNSSSSGSDWELDEVPSGRIRDALVPSDLFVMGPRQGRAREGRGSVDGTRQGRHDAQRVHTCDRRRPVRKLRRIGSLCELADRFSLRRASTSGNSPRSTPNR